MLKQLIESQRPDLRTYTANQNVYVFKEGQHITFKAVPIAESDGVLWLCQTQNRNAEKLQKFGEITAPKVIQQLNQIFP